MLTPEIATKLLERNGLNRPLNDAHVQRIANQIRQGKWRYNGDTIKISDTEDVLDGQHRLWAVIESKRAVKTCIVYGIERDAFATIDTLRKPRSGADVLSLLGATYYRPTVAMGLTWLIRWQRGILTDYKSPKNRVENADIEEWYRAHPSFIAAAERAMKIRSVANPSIMAFIYYVMSSHNGDLAERMMNTLENPAAVGVNDPFFQLRAYFTGDHNKHKDALVTIALCIKAANAAHANKSVTKLYWRNQGEKPEPFPTLDIGRMGKSKLISAESKKSA